MTAKEFAVKYAGIEVLANVYGKLRPCRVIGYDRNTSSRPTLIALELLDGDGSWIAARNSSLRSSVDLSSIAYTCCWADMSWVKQIEPNKKAQQLYTNKCKVCYSPSRKCMNYIFCSNSKCKSRKQLTYMNAKTQTNYLYCVVCLSRAIKRDRLLGKRKWICESGHTTHWDLKAGDTLEGQARNKAFKYPNKDWIWNGDNWSE